MKLVLTWVGSSENRETRYGARRPRLTPIGPSIDL